MKQPLIIGAAVAVAGIGLLVGSAFASDGTWLQSLLVNCGSAVVLVVPFYWLTQKLNKVERKVGTANQRVDQLSSSLETVAQQVRSLQDLANEHDRQRDLTAANRRQLFRELAEHPTRASLHRALDEGERLGLVDLVHTPGLRAPIYPSATTYLAVIRYFTGDQVAFELQDISGRALPETNAEELIWPLDDADGLKDFFQRVEDRLHRARENGNFDPGHWFQRISATLLAALEQPEARAVVELIGDQWALTDDRAVAIPSGYEILFRRMPYDSADPLPYQHVAAKTWVDEELLDRAYFVGQERLRSGRPGPPPLDRALDQSHWPASVQQRHRAQGRT